VLQFFIRLREFFSCFFFAIRLEDFIYQFAYTAEFFDDLVPVVGVPAN